ncbi:SRPBCC family protein [Nonomuraea roseoviolacea]|uniref:Membrane protein n=1 Tax=Nonomuraea roseoviolacea subsp. carminata TaxID=160689 RepID=A0ABT1K0Q5_9ACTN|nr:SRPBCC family protein [Nonomuraea roseoviolacea]MCP2347570.1 putative membrane protein [Nonomuraea roseoviolacea subsp. carminata]
MMTDRFARALGWTSLMLGTAHLAAPKAVARLCGVDDAPGATTVARLVGGRELLHAALLLGAKNPAQWAWTRVAGDTMDLGVLGRAAANRTGTRRARALAALGVVAGIAALDAACARRGTAKAKGPLQVRASITINKPREEVYRFWRDLENLPSFMIHLDSVRTLDQRRSHWKANGPIVRLEWEAEIIDERAGDLIAWRSVPGTGISTAGLVSFTEGPGGRGTVVDVSLEYGAPGRKLAAAVARMFGEHPEQQVRDDLRRFKQVMETGEVVRSEGSPEGHRALRQLRQRPAQPIGGRA